MRKLMLKTLVSLDGFLEGPEGAMDWFGRAAGQDQPRSFAVSRADGAEDVGPGGALIMRG